MMRSLGGLALAPGDEAIVADNTAGGVVEPAGGVTVVRASGERSSYHARNAGALAARNGWLLFIDADCTPCPDLLERYFDPPPGERAGAVAGEILGDPGQRALAARYARDRKLLSQTDGLYGRGRSVAATGNLMVRRASFDELGGFAEGIRSGGDVDFCLRLRAAGWALEFRPRASVAHHHRETVPALLRTLARYASGSRWLSERHPGLGGRWPLNHQLLLAGADAARQALRGEREEAAFRAIDGLGLVAHNVGWRLPNRAG
jgi:GT2 family glycosyltransferase